jgi:hypothetical protein
VGDRRAVRAFGLGTLRIDMDPLVVSGRIGEGIDT